MKLAIALALLIVVATVAATLTPTVAQDNRALNTPTEFAGKTLVCYMQGNTIDEYILENVALKQVGGRTMLVGIGANVEDNWAAGIHVAVAWDSVQVYLAMTKEEVGKYEELRKLDQNKLDAADELPTGLK